MLKTKALSGTRGADQPFFVSKPPAGGFFAVFRQNAEPGIRFAVRKNKKSVYFRKKSVRLPEKRADWHRLDIFDKKIILKILKQAIKTVE